jgi:hypothetical protein
MNLLCDERMMMILYLLQDCLINIHEDGSEWQKPRMAEAQELLLGVFITMTSCATSITIEGKIHVNSINKNN